VIKPRKEKISFFLHKYPYKFIKDGSWMEFIGELRRAGARGSTETIYRSDAYRCVAGQTHLLMSQTRSRTEYFTPMNTIILLIDTLI